MHSCSKNSRQVDDPFERVASTRTCALGVSLFMCSDSVLYRQRVIEVHILTTMFYDCDCKQGVGRAK